MFNYFKRALWLIPVALTAILCLYFIGLFDRLNERLLERQIEERDNLIEFTNFIQTKKTLYIYLDIIDRFENNNLYLLDKNYTLINDKRHTYACPYSIHNKLPPFYVDKFRDKIGSSNSGFFVHNVVSNVRLDFAYKHIKVENKDYIILLGIRNYPKTPEEKELHIAIGLLLLFTALCNWIIIVYAKHIRYICLRKNKK